ncbi:MAG: DUF1684 domain-containing protein [Candidatus Kapabacteria bacterium]|nr:DUF1684 domain-containing protein [Candidatus Kapabacteria bacterium]
MTVRLFVVAVLAMAWIVTACEEEQGSALNGFDEQEVVDARAAKDDFLKNSDDSPIPIEMREHFNGLSYFEPSEAFIVDATYAPFSRPDTIVMPTTDPSDVRRTLRMGTLTFTLNGTRCKLTAYQEIPDADDGLFVPFKDRTTGNETYGGGRYLNVTDVGDSTVTIDFNSAYNPYCAYNDNYTCPLVPDGNTLRVAIRAGERRWK